MFILVVAVAVINFYSTGNDLYNPTGYDNTTFSYLEGDLDELVSIANETQERIERVEANPLIPDVLGTLVVSGIGGAKTAGKSVDVYASNVQASIEVLPVGDLGPVISAAAIGTLIIILTVGILLHLIRQSDRL